MALCSLVAQFAGLSFPLTLMRDQTCLMKPTLPPAATIADRRVLVIGDVLLDRYWHGDVSRISPEAPVPVVRVEREEDRPGGAANVTLNVRM